jgi:uncharacterized membrane protein/glutaredoxin
MSTIRNARVRQELWIVRWSPIIVCVLGLFGAILTGYLTATHYLGGGTALCSAQGAGCDLVLSSEYAKVFGVPLPIFGALGYLTLAGLAITPKFVEEGKKQENFRRTTSLLQFMVSTATLVFSGYLMYLLAFVLKTACPYCIVSAVTVTTIWVFTVWGNRWQDVGQLLFTGFIVGIVTVTGTLVIYGIQSQALAVNNSFAGRLAQHLQTINAKMYGAYTCPYCQRQKALFGDAAKLMPYVECAPDGQNSQTDLCRQKNITGYPTWEINGNMHSGLRSLEELADLSGYKGSRQ